MAQQKKSNLFELGSAFNSSWESDNHSNKPLIKQSIKAQNQHQLHIRFEKRKGKPLTMVGLFYIDEEDLKALLTKIKKSLACGGSIERDEEKQGDYLLFQGDHKAKIKPLFEKASWRFKT